MTIGLRWMERMLERENRMPDVNIAVSFVRVSMMFASTSHPCFWRVRLAMLGQVDNVREIIAGLAHARPASSASLMEIQLFLLTAIFRLCVFQVHLGRSFVR